jgi:16S rRNA (cytosine967-C5)-methyltransferase
MQLDDLDQRDAALATAIEHAVMRRWLTLARIIESQLTRRWSEVEFRMQAVLLVGAAQLLLMERVPDHAIVHEAVEWAKSNIRPKAGAMVNAVLRKVAGLRGDLSIAKPQAGKMYQVQFSGGELPLGDGRVLRLNADVFDASPLPRLA